MHRLLHPSGQKSTGKINFSIFSHSFVSESVLDCILSVTVRFGGPFNAVRHLALTKPGTGTVYIALLG